MSAAAAEAEPRHNERGWKLVEFSVETAPDGSSVGVFQYQRPTGEFMMDRGSPRLVTETRVVERPQRPRFWDRLGGLEEAA